MMERAVSTFCLSKLGLTGGPDSPISLHLPNPTQEWTKGKAFSHCCLPYASVILLNLTVF